jgi:glycosyltransferase involved in cell wall biosynthesis
VRTTSTTYLSNSFRRINNMSRISVIITSHERPKPLSRALSSLSLQDCDDFEVVLSMDSWCAESIATFNSWSHPAKRLLVLPNARGPAETRNVAKQVATGKWVIFLDDDDQLVPGYLNNLKLSALDSSTVVWTNYIIKQCGSNNTNRVDDDWEPVLIADRELNDLEVSNFIPNSALIYPTALIRNIDFDHHLASLEDWDFLINVSRRFQLRSINVFGPIINKDDRLVTRNNGSQKNNDHFMDIIHIYRKWRSLSSDIRRERFRKLNGRHLGISEMHL